MFTDILYFLADWSNDCYLFGWSDLLFFARTSLLVLALRKALKSFLITTAQSFFFLFSFSFSFIRLKLMMGKKYFWYHCLPLAVGMWEQMTNQLFPFCFSNRHIKNTLENIILQTKTVFLIQLHQFYTVFRKEWSFNVTKKPNRISP